MKKKTLGSIAVSAFALCMVSTCLLSGTLAKYTTEATGTGKVMVAKFVDISNIASSGNAAHYAFNLHDTKWDNDKVEGNKIGPGDKGSIDVVLGTSDVAYTYTLALSTIENNIPIKFTDSEGAAWANGTVRTGNQDGQTVTIYWEWKNLDTDAGDDADNDAEDFANDQGSNFTITLNATQVVGAST